MKPPSIRPGGRPGAGIFLASLLVLLLAPGARAGCGGRAIHPTKGATAGLMMLALAQASNLAAATDGAQGCSSALCSERDPVSPAMSFQSVPDRGDGLPAIGPALDGPPDMRRLFPAEARRYPPRTPFGVFHPPRRPR